MKRADKHLNREKVFRALLEEIGVPQPTTELQFCSDRKWRFDFAWIPWAVALEVEGGIWVAGRHSRGKGFLADIEKYNRATLEGWRVFRTTPDELLTPETAFLIQRAIQQTRAA